ncbi:MAG TPA: hypothetical protein VEA99_08355 [Gemmatimonadaceae bacterium]|nr:hypothetical protein [Gemmatimonadaceae bacterium]
MAADSTPPSPALAAATLQAVRDALVGYLADPQRSDELRAALGAMAAEARAKAILPERLLVTLKDLWYGLPPVRHATDGMEQARLLQRIVTMCIREYYR